MDSNIFSILEYFPNISITWYSGILGNTDIFQVQYLDLKNTGGFLHSPTHYCLNALKLGAFCDMPHIIDLLM